MNKLRRNIILIFIIFILFIIGITSNYVYAKYVISEHKEITILVKSTHEEP